MIRFFRLFAALCLLSVFGCAVTTESVDRSKVLEDAKTERESQYYAQQLAYLAAVERIANKPLVDVTTPDGTRVVVNREVAIPKIEQYQNQPTFGEKVTLAAIGATRDVVVSAVPFAGAAVSQYYNYKTTEVTSGNQVRMLEAMHPLYGGQPAPGDTTYTWTNAPTTTTSTETTTETTTETSYGAGSGNSVGGDSVIRQSSPDSTDNSIADSYDTESTVSESYNDQSTEAPVVPIVPVVTAVEAATP